MATLKTPSGLSVSEAEKLSQQVKYNIPKEGQLFRETYSGRDTPIYQMRGGKIYTLDPMQFAGEGYKTSGELFTRSHDWVTQALGIKFEDIAEINISDAIAGLARAFVPGQTKDSMYAPGPKEKQAALGGGLSKEDFLTKDIAQATTHPGGTTLATLGQQEAIAPENSIAGIQSVFGSQWQPSPAFANLQKQGIFGAVRITGTNEVYTIGPGGRKETAESYLQRFGTNEQAGIVGEISKDQAIKLGITDTKQTPVAGITPEGLTPTTPIDTTGQPTVIGSEADLIVAGAEQTAQDIIKSAEQKKLEGEKEETTESILAGLTALEGEGTAQLAAEEEAGIPEFERQQAEIQGQIGIKTAEYKQLQAQEQALKTEIGDRPITMGSIVGSQAAIERQFLARKNSLATEIGLLQATSLAISGQLTAAQNSVNRSIDLRFSTIEQRIQTQKFLLGIIEADLTKEERIRAEAQNAFLDQQQVILDDQKAIDKQIQNIAITAIVNGATPDVVEQIRQAEDVITATQIAQPYLVEEEVAPTYAPTSAMKEYNLAISQGYKGTFEQWQTKGVEPGIEPSLTAGQVRDIKYLPSPPDWFSKKWEKKLGWRIPQPYPTERIQQEWDKLRVDNTEDEIDQAINEYLKNR